MNGSNSLFTVAVRVEVELLLNGKFEACFLFSRMSTKSIFTVLRKYLSVTCKNRAILIVTKFCIIR